MPVCTRDALLDALKTSAHLILLGHVDPDGDALGSQLALARGLKSLGKTVECLNVGIFSHLYTWMVDEGEVRFFEREGPFPQHLKADLIVALDFNGWSRLLGFADVIERSGIRTAVIDHHPGEEPSADLTYVDVTACSTGLMVWELLKDLKVDLSYEMAVPAYVSVITDTGHFKYSNTDTRAHQAAIEHIGLGVNPVEMYGRIYQTSSLNRLKLMGAVLNRLHTELEGRLVWVAITRAERQAAGVSEDEVEGYIDAIRRLDTHEVAVLFRELDNGTIKVSMRSRGFDVGSFAKQFNGGGHTVAAGISSNKSLDTLVENIIEELKKALS